MRLSEKIHFVLKEAYPTLASLEDEWCIIGTSALVLSGVEFDKTKDIDILTSAKDAQKIKQSWKSRIIKDFDTSNSELFRSELTRYNFKLMDIEIIGDLDVFNSGQWIPLKIQDYINISTPDFEVKIPSIEEQKRILHLFGREKDLQKIKYLDLHEENWGRANG